jgi:hypothetical protein
MSDVPISPEAKQLIARSIYSIEQLEIFLLLGKDARRLYTQVEIFRVIKTNEASIGRCLELFVRDGLATAQSDGHFQFVSDAKLLGVAAELAQAYRERSVAVIGLIYNKPDQQMRSFANAFRFRKES